MRVYAAAMPSCMIAKDISTSWQNQMCWFLACLRWEVFRELLLVGMTAGSQHDHDAGSQQLFLVHWPHVISSSFELRMSILYSCLETLEVGILLGRCGPQLHLARSLTAAAAARRI
jgi:hypothetical protein